MNRNFYINGSAAPARIIDEPVRNPRRTAPLTKGQIRKRQVDRYAEATGKEQSDSADSIHYLLLLQ